MDFSRVYTKTHFIAKTVHLLVEAFSQRGRLSQEIHELQKWTISPERIPGFFEVKESGLWSHGGSCSINLPGLGFVKRQRNLSEVEVSARWAAARSLPLGS